MQGSDMTILFQSNTEEETEFEFEGQKITNKGLVKILESENFNGNIAQ